MVVMQRHSQDEVPGLAGSGSTSSSSSSSNIDSMPFKPTRLYHISPNTPRRTPRIPVDDFEFAVTTLDLINADRRTLLSCLWNFLLGAAALLDFVATVLPMWFVNQVKATTKPRADIYEFRRRHDGLFETNDPLFVDLLVWMRQKAATFGFLFSLLCFLDIFVRAHRRREQEIRHQDREVLFGTTRYTKKVSSKWWKGASGVYYQTILFHLLLLPVSFYFLIYHWFHLWIETDDAKVDKDEHITIVIRGLRKFSGTYETFSTNIHTGLGVSIIRYFILLFVRDEAAAIRAAVIGFGMRIFRFAIRHPKLFGRRIRTTLTCLRWVKYLAPLIGTFNKLLGNSLDLIKRYNQRRQLLRAEKARERIWRKLPPDELRLYAAVRIQSRARSYQSRRSLAALRLIRGEKEAFAALKVQKVLRGMLARARVRLRAKERELKLLLQKADDVNANIQLMSVNDRKRIYQLKDELNMVADKLINRELLLRPNTYFSVAWRFIFVACVVFEISVLIFQPRLAKFKDKKTGKPLDISRIMQATLVPDPISTWEACAIENVKPKKGPGIIHAVQKIIPKKKKPSIVEAKHKQAPRWYCHHLIARTHSLLIAALKWLICEFMAFLGFVSFIDVPISFFIGEIDPVTGALVPKDWFTRWILPGIVLQLVVNPQMGRIASFLVSLARGAFLVGVERAYRWVVMLFLPLLAIVVHFVLIYIWHPIVKRQNKMLFSSQRKDGANLSVKSGRQRDGKS